MPKVLLGFLFILDYILEDSISSNYLPKYPPLLVKELRCLSSSVPSINFASKKEL